MSMGAIKQYTDNISEAVLAVNAGNDIILTSDYYMHYDAVIEAYKSGKIYEATINSACKRILAWKLKYLLNHEPQPQPEPEDKDNTYLIIISVVLGLIIVGALITFLIIWIKNKPKSDPKDEKLNNEYSDSGII